MRVQNLRQGLQNLRTRGEPLEKGLESRLENLGTGEQATQGRLENFRTRSKPLERD